MAEVQAPSRSSDDDKGEKFVPRAIEKSIKFGDRQLTSPNGTHLGLMANVLAVMLLNDPAGNKGATLTISWEQHGQGWYTGNGDYAMHFKFISMDAARIPVINWELPPVIFACTDNGQDVQHKTQVTYGQFQASDSGSFNTTPPYHEFTLCGS